MRVEYGRAEDADPSLDAAATGFVGAYAAAQKSRAARPLTLDESGSLGH